jgi:C-methyltransferase C-terminal domain/Methyltransferase domain/Putative zinc binding domain
MKTQKKLAAGSGGSVVVDRCQVCDSSELESILFLGYLPPVNTMPAIGTPLSEQPAYPAQLLFCKECTLAQLGLIVDPTILFPPTYPYTSGTTRILRENFAQLSREVDSIRPLKSGELIIDIGSNDGTLLSNFNRNGVRILGIEPTNAAKLAVEHGIPSITSFFSKAVADKVAKDHGKAKIVTATNVFAHIEDIHNIVAGILALLDDSGIFISESHYFRSLLETLQYDTIYHEHLRYYTLTSLKNLVEMHGLEVIHAKRIPTHGGSIRVYAAPRDRHPVRASVKQVLDEEKREVTPDAFAKFKRAVVDSKLGLLALLKEIKSAGGRVYGIGAPSRASTLINYVGLDNGILDCVLEIKGSYKIGKYVPGTIIPVLEESRLFSDQPEYALLLSWHIADELIPKLAARGYKGRYIIPLPKPHVR